MTPEQKARQQIDRQLAEAGWIVQDYKDLNISAGLGVAAREFPLKSGPADYMLYVDGKACGVVEAKPEGHPLTGVETQSKKYLEGLPPALPHFVLPLPFAYESTGEETRFTNYLEPDAKSRRVFTFHRSEELLRLAELGKDRQLRTLLRAMPALATEKLWHVQVEAITNLETSLAKNRPRALIQMATGSGKTFTAVNFCYRLIKYAKAKRILFLVDRNNLGEQTLNEFQQFSSPTTGYKFTEEYSVQHLKRNTIDPAAKVCITTVQRLYSMLQGEPEYLEENEDASLFENAPPPSKEPLPVVYNPNIPIETFDFIVIDECHRSIYNLWRQVLEYFDAFLIGLTATPSLQTIGFFEQNLVQHYTHEKAVADGVNVGFDVFLIETEVTKNGATVVKEAGVFVPHRDRRTRKTRYKELDDDVPYTGQQLDRDVVAPDQIRLVLDTFRQNLPNIFPGRTEVPKTLVFAKTDQHAEDIVKILRDVFDKGNDFCQKITSKTTGIKPKELLQQFRNSYNPRVAVTVDMIATGTDVKPLECLVFLRDVRSANYFDQMKGRGCRIINTDALKSVTPDAEHKTHFVIVDAVGVCKSDKTTSCPLDRKPYVALETLLKQVAAGMVDADIVSTLAARLAKLEQQAVHGQTAAISNAADGKGLSVLAKDLLDSIDADAVAKDAARKFELFDDEKPTEQQLDAAERDRMKSALKPFHNPKLRGLILQLKVDLEQIIDEQTKDKLLKAGFDKSSVDAARSLVTTFKQFLDEHKDEIEALQILYSRPYRSGLRFRQIKELAAALEKPPLHLFPERVWNAFHAIEPAKVKGMGSKAVDVVALVRHALDPAGDLVPVRMTVEERYERWLADQSAAGVAFTPEQRKWLDAIRDHIAASLSIEPDDLDEVPFNQIGGLGKAYELFGEKLPAILDELNARLAA